MLRQLGRRLLNPKTAYSLPDATRVYAIGDVHGCLTILERLLDLIASDAAGYLGKVRLVFLGDLVDRGEDGRGVVEFMCRLASTEANVDVLMGNHEEAMLSAYDGESDARQWLRYGGVQTLESYGISRAEQFDRTVELTDFMRAAIPQRHIDFLRSLPSQVRIGDYLFVHAGIRPGVALDRQTGSDMRWIRDGFLDSDTDHGVVVVHGHTITPTPQSRANRIGIDTGCYAGGPLTALVLEGCERRFLQTSS